MSQLYPWHVLAILPSFNGAQPWPLSFSPVGPSALPGPFTVENGRSTFDVNNPIINYCAFLVCWLCLQSSIQKVSPSMQGNVGPWFFTCLFFSSRRFLSIQLCLVLDCAGAHLFSLLSDSFSITHRHALVTLVWWGGTKFSLYVARTLDIYLFLEATCTTWEGCWFKGWDQAGSVADCRNWDWPVEA